MAVGIETPASESNSSAASAPSQRRAPTAQPRKGDGHRKDPLKPVAGDSGDDFDYDDPSQEAPSREPAKPKKSESGGKAKKPVETNGKKQGDAAPATKPRNQNRVLPPEAGGGDAAVDNFDDGSADDPYERVAQRHDAKEGKRSPPPARAREEKEPAEKPAKTRKPAREEAADEADDELEVGDEVDDEEGGRRDIHAGGDDDSEESGETDDDPFTHPVLLEAKSYGFSEEEAREFGTVDALQKAMEIIDRNLKKLGAEPKPDAANDAASKTPAAGSQTGQTLPENGRSAESGKTQAEPPSAAKLGDAERAFPKLTVKDFDPDGYFDEKTHERLGKIVDHYDGIVHDLHAKTRAAIEANEAISAKFESLVEHYREQNRTRFSEEMNSFFDGLGEKYDGIFGSGDIEDMDPESSEYKNRQGLIAEMNELAKGLRASKQPLSKKRLRERALRLFKPAVEKREKQIRQEAIKKERQRDSQRIAPPTGRTGRQGRDRSAEDRAGDFLDEKYREHGFRVDPHEDYEDEI